MYVDSHVHLYDSKFDEDRDEVIKRAIDSGVEAFVVPGIDVTTSEQAIELTEKYDSVYAAVGIHPHEASKISPEDYNRILKLSEHEKVVAIGEIGLDYHYDFSPPDVQKEVFAEQIRLAQKRNLPIIVHNRKAVDDTLAIIEKIMKQDPKWRSEKLTPQSRYTVPKGVLHCFDGTVKNAKRALNMGFLISYPGILTFKNSPAVEIASLLSVEYFLLETDAPYMAPPPHRGKRNEPAFIVPIAEKLAECQKLFVEDIARTTNYNVYRLFGIGEMEPPKIAYKLRNSLYLNITLRCNADCVFCDRKGDAMIKGHNLRIEKEPGVAEILDAIGDPTDYDEIVFCGYGEPTIRLNTVKQVARWVKQRRGKVRLNTDGHGDVINKRNIIPELVGLVDSISISLNTIDPKQYGELMQIDGEKFFNAMMEFTKEAKKHMPEVVMTIVDIEDVDVEKARKFVEEELGVTFKLRPYF